MVKRYKDGRIDCTGTKARKALCSEYNVRFLQHLRIINGKSVISNAGRRKIEHDYFILGVSPKGIPNQKEEFIFCGYEPAKDFAHILQSEMPAIFDPLKSVKNSTNGNHGSTKENPSSSSWNVVRKELYNAVMLVILYLETDVTKNTALSRIALELSDRKYISYYPSRSAKGFATIMKKYPFTVYDVLHDLSQKNDLKNYSFEKLRSYIAGKGLYDFIGDIN